MLIKYDPEKYALKVEIKRLREALETIIKCEYIANANSVAVKALTGDE